MAASDRRGLDGAAGNFHVTALSVAPAADGCAADASCRRDVGASDGYVPAPSILSAADAGAGVVACRRDLCAKDEDVPAVPFPSAADGCAAEASCRVHSPAPDDDVPAHAVNRIGVVDYVSGATTADARLSAAADGGDIAALDDNVAAAATPVASDACAATGFRGSGDRPALDDDVSAIEIRSAANGSRDVSACGDERAIALDGQRFAFGNVYAGASLVSLDAVAPDEDDCRIAETGESRPIYVRMPGVMGPVAMETGVLERHRDAVGDRDLPAHVFRQGSPQRRVARQRYVARQRREADHVRKRASCKTNGGENSN